MIIGIDLDEVLADTMSTLIVFHNERYGTTFKREDFHSYHWYKVWGGTKEESIQKYFEYAKTPYFKNTKPVKDAIEAIDTLSAKHKLIIITSRQREHIKQTKEWIHEHFPNKFQDIFVTNHPTWAVSGKTTTKKSICEEHDVDLLIEDSLEYAQECASEKTSVLLLDTPWNQGMEPAHVYRVHSWKELLRHKLLQ